MGNVLVGIPTRIQVSRCGENLLGHYPTVTGTPATFILRIGWAKRSPPGRGALRHPGHVHPADRLGQTVATGPGCLATSCPRQPGWALLSFVSLLESASGRKSFDRSRKLSCNSTSSTSGVLAGTAGQPLAITSLK